MPKKTIEVETKFYTFRQNNSGGRFYGPVYVIIEARNTNEANSLAQSKADVYFDGRGDCSCCGRRWCKLSDYEEGDEVPSIHETPITEYKDKYAWEGYGAKVYFFDGTTKYYKHNNKTKMYEESEEVTSDEGY